jgi:hypothetical protein
MQIPLNDAIIAAVAQIIDDSQSSTGKREPTHSDLDFYVSKVDLLKADPKQQKQVVGKAKRLRAILHVAQIENEIAGSRLIELVLAKVCACGGFREDSPNYVGKNAIDNARHVFDREGFTLSSDGHLSAKVLDHLSPKQMTEALLQYATRAQKGAHDAALLTGTSKDLLEATAAHVLRSINGNYPQNANFQGLLGMAFIALEMAVPEIPAVTGEKPIKPLERAFFHTACAINKLRNKEGTGHGRPWLTSLSDNEAKASIETVGTIASYMLSKLRERGY